MPEAGTRGVLEQQGDGMGFLKTVGRIFVDFDDQPPGMDGEDDSLGEGGAVEPSEVDRAGGTSEGTANGAGVERSDHPAEGDESADVFRAAGIPESRFPAERMLEMLGKLPPMDDVTRRNTVLALAEANRTWSIEDPINDARAKIEALRDEISALTARAASEEQEAQTRLQENQGNEAQLREFMAAQFAKLAEEREALEESARTAMARSIERSGVFKHKVERLQEMLDVLVDD